MNFFSYDYFVSDYKFFIKSAESNEDVELEYEIKSGGVSLLEEKYQKGMYRDFFNDKFKLMPNRYLFFFRIYCND